MKIKGDIDSIDIHQVSKEELGETQQYHIKNKVLLEYFDDELFTLLHKYIDVKNKNWDRVSLRDWTLFCNNKEIFKKYNDALDILQRLIKETYKT